MSAASVSADDYARAERFLSWNKDRYVANCDIQHRWIGRQDRFWYLRKSTDHRKEFVVVDAVTGKKAPAFEHEKVAAGLSAVVRERVEATSLPFDEFRFTPDCAAVEFTFDGHLWRCRLDTGSCTREALATAAVGEVLSPDGKWAAYRHEHNLWIRPASGGTAIPLTTDGTEHYGYAGSPGDNRSAITDLRRSTPRQCEVIWSPDSRYLATHRLDERDVKDMFLVQSVPEDGSVRPRLFTHRYALPGDENVPLVEPVVFDVSKRRLVRIETPPLVEFMMTPIAARNAWWSGDGRKLYYLDMDRFSRSLILWFADPVDGKVTEVVRETSETFLLPGDGGLHNNPVARVLSNGDVIWYSQRDGWGHLYYYEATGRLRNQITRGEWVVRGIGHIHEAGRHVYFVASGREEGRDPYYRHVYRVRMDGSGLELLTPEDAEHDLASNEGESDAFSPSGRHFVYSHSRPDAPPVLTLRTADGALVAELETADTSALEQGGRTPIEPFQVLAADGETAIYGNLYRPSWFDPGRKYPVIDSVYPGPQRCRARKTFTAATFDDASALAELGFIVIAIDGRGTPHRSKAFLDDCYGQMGKAGNLDDHIAGIRQLAERYPCMDLERVGIYGASGGGYAAAHAILTRRDFYKVAVAAEGNHDQLGYCFSWAETYNGPVGEGDYRNASNLPFTGSLEGKLLLMHGEMDDNVPPAQTMKLVDALIKANKDFDLLLMPNGNHDAYKTPYFIRRKWDYFVRHLKGAEPPHGYRITSPNS